ncbi:hypothetical protein [Schinkia azotoformans]|nr:hypothetical protein [Schinkia azotoformans]MEC1789116.1 hypothetical protein [Schinkia azotoformans]
MEIIIYFCKKRSVLNCLTKKKGKFFVSLMVMAFCILLIPVISTANNTEKSEKDSLKKSNDIAFELPILKTTPANTEEMVPVNPKISIELDSKHKNFNRFREQFEKGAFEILLNDNVVDSSFDSFNKIITINNAKLKFDSQYTLKLKTKANYKSNNDVKNASYSFTFFTEMEDFEVISIE